jgi:hypothetical protein
VSTNTFQRLGVTGLAALAVVGLLSGCASKKKTASTAAAGSSSAASAGAAAPSSAAAVVAPSTTPTKVVATGGGKFCQEVASSINNSAAQEAEATSAPTSIKQDIQNEQAVEAQVLKESPSAIKPDLLTIFGATDKLYAALAAANYDYSKIDPTQLSTLDSPQIMTAEQNIETYVKNTCGVDLGITAATSAEASASAAEQSLLAQLSAAVSPSS